MQQRRFPRLRICTDASIKTRKGIIPGTLENLSLSGLFVRTGGEMAVGDTSEIIFPLPAVSQSNKVHIRVVAVRVEDQGVAFSFRNIDHATFSLLKSILKNRGAMNLAA
jgi:PilZ domain